MLLPVLFSFSFADLCCREHWEESVIDTVEDFFIAHVIRANLV
jgi:hypothetical protein